VVVPIFGVVFMLFWHSMLGPDYEEPYLQRAGVGPSSKSSSKEDMGESSASKNVKRNYRINK